VGRPRLRWLKDGENNLRDLKVRILKQKGNNKEKWLSVVKETKVLRGS
jgi:hypothetical protein